MTVRAEVTRNAFLCQKVRGEGERRGGGERKKKAVSFHGDGSVMVDKTA